MRCEEDIICLFCDGDLLTPRPARFVPVSKCTHKLKESIYVVDEQDMHNPRTVVPMCEDHEAEYLAN